MKKCMSITMMGETAYKLKDIEFNENIKVSKLRADIRNEVLKSAGKSGMAYYVIQSDLDKYLMVAKKRVQVSQKQIDDMKHSLGLNYSKKPYRNRFYCESSDKSWNNLVEKGLAKKGQEIKGQCCFYLTKLGVLFILGKSLDVDKYEEL